MEGEPAIPDKKEAELNNYEHTLELFRRLKEEGLKNPLDEDNPKVWEARDALNAWEYKIGFRDDIAIGTMEQAKEFVRSSRLLLEAGFTGKAVRADTKERLDDLYAMALRGQDVEVVAYITSELEKIEPKNSVDRLIDAKIIEVDHVSPTDAIGILTCLLLDSRAKRMTVQQRQRIEDLRTAKRTEAGAPPPGQSWKK